MYCTYRSLNQMMKYKKNKVLLGKFQCDSNEITSTDKLKNKTIISKYFGNNTK